MKKCAAHEFGNFSRGLHSLDKEFTAILPKAFNIVEFLVLDEWMKSYGEFKFQNGRQVISDSRYYWRFILSIPIKWLKSTMIGMHVSQEAFVNSENAMFSMLLV